MNDLKVFKEVGEVLFEVLFEECHSEFEIWNKPSEKIKKVVLVNQICKGYETFVLVAIF